MLLTLAMADISVAQPNWQELPDMPVARWEAGTVVLDGKIFVFGGYTQGPRSTTRADCYDAHENKWTQLAGLPSSITHMNAVLDGRTVWIAGGFKDGYPGKAINEVWNYDIDKNTYSSAHQIARNHSVSGLRVFSKIVPAVTEVWCRHDRQTNRPREADQAAVSPQRGQTNPSGHRS